MELTTGWPPPERRIRWRDTCRLVPSRFPAVGVFDRVASPGDLDVLFELESWTNDRINVELGALQTLPRHEWVAGRPHASVIMAAFCHPRPGGGRFTGEARGGWYGGRTLDTAIAETVHHRTRELDEIGSLETRVEMRLYLADFSAAFHDVRQLSAFRALHDPERYDRSQAAGRELFEAGSNGILYRSVRHRGGTCLVCFRPARVENVRIGGHFEYRWEGTRTPVVRRLS